MLKQYRSEEYDSILYLIGQGLNVSYDRDIVVGTLTNGTYYVGNYKSESKEYSERVKDGDSEWYFVEPEKAVNKFFDEVQAKIINQAYSGVWKDIDETPAAQKALAT